MTSTSRQSIRRFEDFNGTSVHDADKITMFSSLTYRRRSMVVHSSAATRPQSRICGCIRFVYEGTGRVQGIFQPATTLDSIDNGQHCRLGIFVASYHSRQRKFIMGLYVIPVCHAGGINFGTRNHLLDDDWSIAIGS